MAARLIICNIKCENSLKQGAKLQQARLIGASDNVNKRRGALAPAGIGGGFKPTTDGRMEPAAYRSGGHRRLLLSMILLLLFCDREIDLRSVILCTIIGWT